VTTRRSDSAFCSLVIVDGGDDHDDDTNTDGGAGEIGRDTCSRGVGETAGPFLTGRETSCSRRLIYCLTSSFLLLTIGSSLIVV
jgi:hypothetical protein